MQQPSLFAQDHNNTTKNKPEAEYGCEIVVRPPTINFVACTIASNFTGAEGRAQLKELLGDIHINHWEEINEVLPHYPSIKEAILRVSVFLHDRQTPLIMGQRIFPVGAGDVGV